jgi:hypothetical protein
MLLLLLLLLLLLHNNFLIITLLWHVDPLLGNDRERNSYTTVVTELWLRKQACLHSNNWKQQQRNDIFCAVLAEML